MVIRSAQMEAFRAVSDKGFAEKAIKRLCAFFPKHTEFMGPAAVSAVVRLGINRAREAGFQSERGIQTYLSLMVYFGSEFHRDPQYEWIRPLLENKPASDEKERIDGIIKATGEYAAAVPGPNHENIDRALTTLLNRGPQIVTDMPPPVTLDAIRALLNAVFPEKAAHLKEHGLDKLIQSAHTASRSHQLGGSEPVILFSLLMLLLGTFVDQDAQFAWIGDNLSESSGEAEAQRMKSLTKRCFDRLESWIAAA